MIERPYEAEMKRLWETDPAATAFVLAKRFGVSRNVVVGLAHRRGWKRPDQIVNFQGHCWHRPYPEARTLHTRLDALHRKMDQLLEEIDAGKAAHTRPFLERPASGAQRGNPNAHRYL